MSDELSFFDENPVIDGDTARPRTGALTVDSLPTDITIGEALLNLATPVTIARNRKSGLLELRTLNRRERFMRWLERHPRWKAVLEGAVSVAVLTLPRRPAR